MYLVAIDWNVNDAVLRTPAVPVGLRLRSGGERR